MAAAFTLRCVRAPINITASAIGLANATCNGVAYDVVQISEDLQGIRALAPGADKSRTVLYFHGGSHWLLTPYTYMEFIGRLSAVTQACVIAVDYRKPPEVCFPAGLEDALAAWRWAREQDPQDSVAVAGDSSGGNLAFALVVKLAQLNETQPVACIGISPWLRLDMDMSLGSLYGRVCADFYLGGKKKTTSAADPLVSPVNAESDLVRRFPPILMHVGRNEITTEDVKEMAEVCERAGTPAEVKFYPAPHIFQVGPGFSESTRDSMNRISEFLGKHWQQSAES